MDSASTIPLNKDDSSSSFPSALTASDASDGLRLGGSSPFNNVGLLGVPTPFSQGELDDLFANSLYYDGYKFSVGDIVQILATARMGFTFQQAKVFQLMFEREPIIAAHMMTRVNAVLGLPWSIKTDDSDPNGEAKARAITKILNKAGLRNLMYRLQMGANVFGYDANIIQWDTTGAKTAIAQFSHVDPSNVYYDIAGRVEMRGMTSEVRELITPQNCGKYVIHCYNPLPGIPSTGGLMRLLCFYWLFKHETMKHMVRYIEKFGMPQIVAKLKNEDFNDETRRRLVMDNIRKLGSDGAMLVNEACMIEPFRAEQHGTNAEFQSKIEYFDSVSAKVILGQTATQGDKSGWSNGSPQAAVRQDLLEADSLALMETINSQVIAPLEYHKWGTENLHFEIAYNPPEDVQKLATALSTIAPVVKDMGKQFDPDEVSQRIGMKLIDIPKTDAAAVPAMSALPATGNTAMPLLPPSSPALGGAGGQPPFPQPPATQPGPPPSPTEEEEQPQAMSDAPSLKKSTAFDDSDNEQADSQPQPLIQQIQQPPQPQGEISEEEDIFTPPKAAQQPQQLPSYYQGRYGLPPTTASYVANIPDQDDRMQTVQDYHSKVMESPDLEPEDKAAYSRFAQQVKDDASKQVEEPAMANKVNPQVIQDAQKQLEARLSHTASAVNYGDMGTLKRDDLSNEQKNSKLEELFEKEFNRIPKTIGDQFSPEFKEQAKEDFIKEAKSRTGWSDEQLAVPVQWSLGPIADKEKSVNQQSFITNIGEVMWRSELKTGLGIYGAIDVAAHMFGTSLPETFRQERQYYDAMFAVDAMQGHSKIANAVYSIVDFATGALPGITPIGVVSNFVLAPIGDTYYELKDKGVSEGTAIAASLGVGTAMGFLSRAQLTSVIPANALIDAALTDSIRNNIGASVTKRVNQVVEKYGLQAVRNAFDASADWAKNGIYPYIETALKPGEAITESSWGRQLGVAMEKKLKNGSPLAVLSQSAGTIAMHALDGATLGAWQELSNGIIQDTALWSNDVFNGTHLTNGIDIREQGVQLLKDWAYGFVPMVGMSLAGTWGAPLFRKNWFSSAMSPGVMTEGERASRNTLGDTLAAQAQTMGLDSDISRSLGDYASSYAYNSYMRAPLASNKLRFEFVDDANMKAHDGSISNGAFKMDEAGNGILSFNFAPTKKAIEDAAVKGADANTLSQIMKSSMDKVFASEGFGNWFLFKSGNVTESQLDAMRKAIDSYSDKGSYGWTDKLEAQYRSDLAKAGTSGTDIDKEIANRKMLMYIESNWKALQNVTQFTAPFRAMSNWMREKFADAIELIANKIDPEHKKYEATELRKQIADDLLGHAVSQFRKGDVKTVSAVSEESKPVVEAKTPMAEETKAAGEFNPIQLKVNAPDEAIKFRLDSILAQSKMHPDMRESVISRLIRLQPNEVLLRHMLDQELEQEGLGDVDSIRKQAGLAPLQKSPVTWGEEKDYVDAAQTGDIATAKAIKDKLEARLKTTIAGDVIVKGKDGRIVPLSKRIALEEIKAQPFEPAPATKEAVAYTAGKPKEFLEQLSKEELAKVMAMPEAERAEGLAAMVKDWMTKKGIYHPFSINRMADEAKKVYGQLAPDGSNLDALGGILDSEFDRLFNPTGEQRKQQVAAIRTTRMIFHDEGGTSAMFNEIYSKLNDTFTEDPVFKNDAEFQELYRQLGEVADPKSSARQIRDAIEKFISNQSSRENLAAVASSYLKDREAPALKIKYVVEHLSDSESLKLTRTIGYMQAFRKVLDDADADYQKRQFDLQSKSASKWLDKLGGIETKARRGADGKMVMAGPELQETSAMFNKELLKFLAKYTKDEKDIAAKDLSSYMAGEDMAKALAIQMSCGNMAQAEKTFGYFLESRGVKPEDIKARMDILKKIETEVDSNYSALLPAIQAKAMGDLLTVPINTAIAPSQITLARHEIMKQEQDKAISLLKENEELRKGILETRANGVEVDTTSAPSLENQKALAKILENEGFLSILNPKHIKDMRTLETLADFNSQAQAFVSGFGSLRDARLSNFESAIKQQIGYLITAMTQGEKIIPGARDYSKDTEKAKWYEKASDAMLRYGVSILRPRELMRVLSQGFDTAKEIVFQPLAEGYARNKTLTEAYDRKVLEIQDEIERLRYDEKDGAAYRNFSMKNLGKRLDLSRAGIPWLKSCPVDYACAIAAKVDRVVPVPDEQGKPIMGPDGNPVLRMEGDQDQIRHLLHSKQFANEKGELNEQDTARYVKSLLDALDGYSKGYREYIIRIKNELVKDMMYNDSCDTYMKMCGVPLEDIPDYWPIRNLEVTNGKIISKLGNPNFMQEVQSRKSLYRTFMHTASTTERTQSSIGFASDLSFNDELRGLMAESARYSALAVPLAQVGMLLNNKDLMSAAERTGKPQQMALESLKEWHQNVMSPQASNTVDKVLRNFSSVSMLALRPTVWLLQFTSIPMALRNMTPAEAWHAISDTKSWNSLMWDADWIYYKSEFMKNRSRGTQVDFKTAQNSAIARQAFLDPTLTNRMKSFLPSMVGERGATIKRDAMWAISMIDQHAANMAWAMHYKKAIREGQSEVDAIKAADDIVIQTQHLTDPIFASELFRGTGAMGTVARSFTLFLTPFSRLVSTQFDDIYKGYKMATGVDAAQMAKLIGRTDLNEDQLKQLSDSEKLRILTGIFFTCFMTPLVTGFVQHGPGYQSSDFADVLAECELSAFPPVGNLFLAPGIGALVGLAAQEAGEGDQELENNKKKWQELQVPQWTLPAEVVSDLFTIFAQGDPTGHATENFLQRCSFGTGDYIINWRNKMEAIKKYGIWAGIYSSSRLHEAALHPLSLGFAHSANDEADQAAKKVDSMLIRYNEEHPGQPFRNKLPSPTWDFVDHQLSFTLNSEDYQFLKQVATNLALRKGGAVMTLAHKDSLTPEEVKLIQGEVQKAKALARKFMLPRMIEKYRGNIIRKNYPNDLWRRITGNGYKPTDADIDAILGIMSKQQWQGIQEQKIESMSDADMASMMSLIAFMDNRPLSSLPANVQGLILRAAQLDQQQDAIEGELKALKAQIAPTIAQGSVVVPQLNKTLMWNPPSSRMSLNKQKLIQSIVANLKVNAITASKVVTEGSNASETNGFVKILDNSHKPHLQHAPAQSGQPQQTSTQETIKERVPSKAAHAEAAGETSGSSGSNGASASSSGGAGYSPTLQQSMQQEEQAGAKEDVQQENREITQSEKEMEEPQPEEKPLNNNLWT